MLFKLTHGLFSSNPEKITSSGLQPSTLHKNNTGSQVLQAFIKDLVSQNFQIYTIQLCSISLSS
jgi:hypothetical protein